MHAAALALVAGFAASTPSDALAQAYSMTRVSAQLPDLLTPVFISPGAMNGFGQIVFSADAGTGAQSFVSGPHGIGLSPVTIPGVFQGDAVIGYAPTAINSSGTLAGVVNALYTQHPSDDRYVEAVASASTGSGLTGLGFGPADENGHRGSEAFGINDAGVIVGETYVGGVHQNQAFTTGPGGVGMYVLGSFWTNPPAGHGQSTARGVNASWQVTGWSDDGIGSQAFITAPGGILMRGLGSLSLFGDSFANAINDLGQVTGQSYNGTTLEAFVTGPNGYDMIGLGTLGNPNARTFGLDINNAGAVVGTMDGPQLATRGFVYLPGMGLTLLDDLVQNLGTFHIEQALAINDAGEIAAIGYDAMSGRYDTLLLTPLSTAPTTAPEPDGRALLAAGLVLLVAGARWHQRRLSA